MGFYEESVGRRRKYIIRMSCFQGFYLMRDRDMRTNDDGLNEGWIINGQKMLVQVISGTAAFTVVVGMYLVAKTWRKYRFLPSNP